MPEKSDHMICSAKPSAAVLRTSGGTPVASHVSSSGFRLGVAIMKTATDSAMCVVVDVRSPSSWCWSGPCWGIVRSSNERAQYERRLPQGKAAAGRRSAVIYFGKTEDRRGGNSWNLGVALNKKKAAASVSQSVSQSSHPREK